MIVFIDIVFAIIVVVDYAVFIDDVHFAIIYFFCSGVFLKTMTLFYIGCLYLLIICLNFI